MDTKEAATIEKKRQEFSLPAEKKLGKKDVSNELLPPRDIIPKEFLEDNSTSMPWRKAAKAMIDGRIISFKPAPLRRNRRPYNVRNAYWHLSSICHIFGTQKEHRLAAIAWLMSLWAAEPPTL